MKSRHERYQEFFELFHKEGYFQSHEVLEEIWIEETDRKTKNHPAIVLLQFAVALLHWKRGNLKGASLVINSALSHLEKSCEELKAIGIEGRKLEAVMENTLEKIKCGENYSKVKIPRV